MLICRLCLLESDDEEVIISVCDNKQDLAARIKKCVSVEVIISTHIKPFFKSIFVD